jgi:hypothetical protein
LKVIAPQTDVQQVGMQSISVGQVAIGPIQIGTLSIDNFHLGMSSGQVQLHNFRVTVDIAIKLEWWVGVHVPFDGTISDSGTIDFGEPSFTFAFGDVTIPGVQDFSVDIAKLDLSNLTATSSPITNLQLGAAVAEQIQAKNLTLPTQGFSIAGLGLASASMNGLQVPTAAVDQVGVGRVHGEALPLSSILLSNIGIPTVGVGDVTSGQLNVSATTDEYCVSADLGILRVTLCLTPGASARIDQLHISGLHASGSVGRVELNNVVAPYEMLNLTLSQVGINNINIPAVGVS